MNVRQNMTTLLHKTYKVNKLLHNKILKLIKNDRFIIESVYMLRNQTTFNYLNDYPFDPSSQSQNC